MKFIKEFAKGEEEEHESKEEVAPERVRSKRKSIRMASKGRKTPSSPVMVDLGDEEDDAPEVMLDEETPVALDKEKRSKKAYDSETGTSGPLLDVVLQEIKQNFLTIFAGQEHLSQKVGELDANAVNLRDSCS